jgi:fused signal recognition particle receptor
MKFLEDLLNQLPVASASDWIALAFLIGFGLFFVGIGFLALRKKRKERLEILTKASLEADNLHGLQDFVDGKKVPAAKEPDESTPQISAEDYAKAQKAEKHALSEMERAKRDRERVEAEGGDAGSAPESANASAVVQAREAEEAAREALETAKQDMARFKKAMAKTRDGFLGRIGKALGGKQIDSDTLDELEQILFTADIGAQTADRLLEAVKTKLKSNELDNSDRIGEVIKKEIQDIFEGIENKPLATDGDSPRVFLIVGVNGAGKTTSIGKLTHQIVGSGHSVLLGAGDTFRAAATEQLEVWADRNGCPIVKGQEGADPASVLFESVSQAKKDGVDVVLCDTAGRLHTKINLMEELVKCHKVVGKAAEGAPHEVLLVLDATVGQNAIAQAKQFGELMPLTGIILTKLDGTAKGGVVIGIADQLGIPVRYIGVGEKLTDLRRFDSTEFIDALFSGDGSLRTAA